MLVYYLYRVMGKYGELSLNYKKLLQQDTDMDLPQDPLLCFSTGPGVLAIFGSSSGALFLCLYEEE